MADHVPATIQKLFQMVNVLDVLMIYHVLRIITNWILYCRARNSTIILLTFQYFSNCKAFIHNLFSIVRDTKFTCRRRHWWHVITSRYLTKNIFKIYTNSVLIGRQQSLKQCDSMANGSKFIMFKTLHFFWNTLYILQIKFSDIHIIWAKLYQCLRHYLQNAEAGKAGWYW